MYRFIVSLCADLKCYLPLSRDSVDWTRNIVHLSMVMKNVRKVYHSQILTHLGVLANTHSQYLCKYVELENTDTHGLPLPRSKGSSKLAGFWHVLHERRPMWTFATRISRAQTCIRYCSVRTFCKTVYAVNCFRKQNVRTKQNCPLLHRGLFRCSVEDFTMTIVVLRCLSMASPSQKEPLTCQMTYTDRCQTHMPHSLTMPPRPNVSFDWQ